MNRKARRRLLIAVVIVIVAFAAGVVWLVRAQGAYYRQVGELSAGGMDGRTVKVGGAVLGDTISRKGTKATFTMKDLTGQDATIRVIYDGAMPDTFGPGVDVVVLGTYDASRQLITAEELQTKCPSKYRSSASPGAAADQ